MIDKILALLLIQSHNRKCFLFIFSCVEPTECATSDIRNGNPFKDPDEPVGYCEKIEIEQLSSLDLNPRSANDDSGLVCCNEDNIDKPEPEPEIVPPKCRDFDDHK